MARPPTIKQRVAFEGGEEILKTLAALGEEGRRFGKALEQAGKAASGSLGRLNSAVVRFRADLQQLRRRAEAVGAGFGTLVRRGQDLGTSLVRVGRRLTLLAGAAAGAATAIALVARNSARTVEETARAAEGIGLSVRSYGRLKFAAEQAGLAQQDFGSFANRVNQIIAQSAGAAASAGDRYLGFGKRALDAATAIEAAGRRTSLMVDSTKLAADETLNIATALRVLGVRLTDARGVAVNTDEAILRLADAFAKLPDGIKKSTLAVTLFPELGRRALPFLNRARIGIEDLGTEAEGLGLIFTEQQVRIAAALVAAETRLTRSVGALKDQVGLLFAPALTEGANQLTAALLRNRAALLSFVGDLVPRAVQLFEDLIAALQGRDADVHNLFILEARDAILGFARDLQGAVQDIILPAFRAVIRIFDIVATGINAVFGTQFTGREIAIAAIVGQLLGVFGLFASTIGLVSAEISLLFNIFAALGSLAKTVGSFFAVIAGLAGLSALNVAAFAAAIALIVIFWDEIVAAARAAYDFIVANAGPAWEAVVKVFRAGAGQLRALLASAFDAIGDLAAGLAERITGALQGALARVRAIVAAIRALISSAGSAAASAGTGAAATLGFARGGRVVGPGTATSDSVPIRASVGEFVIQAKAVRHYGARLFAALNALAVPARGRPAWASPALGPGFALGGLVAGIAERLDSALAPPRLPGFVQGGLVAAPAAAAPAGRALHLHLGGQVFTVASDEATAEALTRALLRKQRASAGKKPPWYGQ